MRLLEDPPPSPLGLGPNRVASAVPLSGRRVGGSRVLSVSSSFGSFPWFSMYLSPVGLLPVARIGPVPSRAPVEPVHWLDAGGLELPPAELRSSAVFRCRSTAVFRARGLGIPGARVCSCVFLAGWRFCFRRSAGFWCGYRHRPRNFPVVRCSPCETDARARWTRGATE